MVACNRSPCVRGLRRSDIRVAEPDFPSVRKQRDETKLRNGEIAFSSWRKGCYYSDNCMLAALEGLGNITSTAIQTEAGCTKSCTHFTWRRDPRSYWWSANRFLLLKSFLFFIFIVTEKAQYSMTSEIPTMQWGISQNILFTQRYYFCYLVKRPIPVYAHRLHASVSYPLRTASPDHFPSLRSASRFQQHFSLPS